MTEVQPKKSFNPKDVRPLFPALSQTINGEPLIFFDGPGGTQVPQSVLTAITEYLGTSNANLMDSAFPTVQRTWNVVRTARQNAATFLNAYSVNEIVFGANMTTLTAHIGRSIAREWTAGDEIFVTDLDHFGNVSFWTMMAEEKGVKLHTVPINPDDCTLDYAYIERHISNKTKLIAFTMASNICGSKTTEAARIIKLAKQVGAMTYVDGVHYSPHFLPNVQTLDCDFFACSAYKFFGPHLGILYGKAKHLESLTPYKVKPASDDSPDRWETGTKSFEALAGFNATIDYLARLGQGKDTRAQLQNTYNAVDAYEQEWSRQFLSQAIEIEGLNIYGIKDVARTHERTPTFAITKDGISAQGLSDYLALNNITAGASHFYATGVTDTLNLTESGGVVRIGALHYNTMEELDTVIDLLKAV